MSNGRRSAVRSNIEVASWLAGIIAMIAAIVTLSVQLSEQKVNLAKLQQQIENRTNVLNGASSSVNVYTGIVPTTPSQSLATNARLFSSEVLDIKFVGVQYLRTNCPKTQPILVVEKYSYSGPGDTSSFIASHATSLDGGGTYLAAMNVGSVFSSTDTTTFEYKFCAIDPFKWSYTVRFLDPRDGRQSLNIPLTLDSGI